MDFKDPEMKLVDRLEVREAMRGNLALRPAAELWEEDCTIEWLLPDIIPEGALCILYGRPKSGKSIWALNLAIAEGNMGRFLGRKCRGGRIGLVQLEDPRLLVVNRLKTMCGFAPATLFLSVGRPWSDEMRGQLAFEIEANSLQLLIIDPLVLWRPGVNENAVDEMAALMYELRQVVMLTGCTILVVHHSRKGTGDYGDNMRGSSAIHGSCDVSIELRQRGEDDGIVEMRVISRLTSIEPEILEMDPETLTWYSLGPAGGVKTRQRREEILRFVRESSPCDAGDVVTETGHPRRTVYRDLSRLVSDGLIKSRMETPEGKKKRAIYYV